MMETKKGIYRSGISLVYMTNPEAIYLALSLGVFFW